MEKNNRGNQRLNDDGEQLQRDTHYNDKEHLIEALEEFQSSRMQLLQQLEADLAKAPKGHLLVNHNNQKVHYLHEYKEGGREKRTYLNKSDPLIPLLAQKGYDLKLLPLVKNDLDFLDSILSSGFVDDLSLLYDSLSAERKALVTPYIPSDESFKTTWETCQYNQNKRHPVSRNFPTKRGEYVRSKSEILIANALFDHNIPYRYEAELVLDSKKIYPDFTILNQRTRKILYWEHFGMLENPEYARECSYKLSLFETSGLHLGSDIIITIESRTAPLTLDLINKMIEGYLI